jgi:hypothetical protein
MQSLACVALLLNGLGEPRAEGQGAMVLALDGSGLSPEVTAVQGGTGWDAFAVEGLG